MINITQTYIHLYVHTHTQREREHNIFISCSKEIHSIKKYVKSKNIGKVAIYMKYIKINGQYMKIYFSVIHEQKLG